MSCNALHCQAPRAPSASLYGAAAALQVQGAYSHPHICNQHSCATQTLHHRTNMLLGDQVTSNVLSTHT